MKPMIFLALLGVAMAGCQFTQPEYLHMMSANELNGLMQQQDIVLIDVHTPEQRHIKGTDLFIPYNAVEQHLDKLPKDKAAPLYVYCKGGPMGNSAARTLHDLGYSNIYNLDGGAEAWQQAGFAFE